MNIRARVSSNHTTRADGCKCGTTPPSVEINTERTHNPNDSGGIIYRRLGLGRIPFVDRRLIQHKLPARFPPYLPDGRALGLDRGWGYRLRLLPLSQCLPALDAAHPQAKQKPLFPPSI
jgi:hypothetical protein